MKGESHIEAAWLTKVKGKYFFLTGETIFHGNETL